MNFGSGSSGTQQTPIQTTTQSKEPWSGAAPYLSDMYATANNMRASNTGYQPWSGPLVAGTVPWQDQALTAMSGMAQNELGGGAGVNAARDYALKMLNPDAGGLTDREAGVVSQLQDMQANGPNESLGILRNVVNQASGQQNPYLQAILDAQNRKIGDRVNASMSGSGRYGSGAHTDVMTRALAEAEAPILASDYEARQERLGKTAGAMMDINKYRTGVMGGIEDIYNTGQGRMGQWAQMAPALDEARYAPAKTLLGLGEYSQNAYQKNLDAAIAQHNAAQAYPWEQLNREAGILAGSGGLGGTTVTGISQAQPGLAQRIFGGALAGAGIGSKFGPWGAPVGAAGGGLLSALL